MSNRVANFYSTDDPYKAVSSNHIYGWKYKNEDKILLIQFHNGATYKLYGVPKGLVDGMEKSPSAGRWYWLNIRQQYPTENTGKKPLGYLAQVDNIQYELYPDLAKLDQIDTQELKVEKSFRSGKIDQEEYYRLMDALTVKRERVIKKLEREGYRFDEDIVQQGPEKTVQTSKSIDLGGLWEGIGVLFDVVKFVIVGVVQIVGVFFSLFAIMSKMGR